VGVGSTPPELPPPPEPESLPPLLPEITIAELAAVEDAAFFITHAEVPKMKKTAPKMPLTYLIPLF
jgi:hypothetical protein